MIARAIARETVIEAKDLTIRFGDFTAVDKLNIEIFAGQIYGFLGPNGSGKSTTIRAMCGILTPASGSCKVLGHDAATDGEAVKQHIGYMSQRFSLYPDLTVQENLSFYANIYGVTGHGARQKIAEILALTGLEDQPDALTGSLSSGIRQRLALGCAILHKPQILFLDEPTSGVDPKSRKLFWQIIYQLAAEGTTILITTHFMDEAEHCDAVGFISDSKLVATGSPTQLKASIQGTLVNIPAADSMGMMAQLAQRNIQALDSYTYGKNLRLLMNDEQLAALSGSGLNYAVMQPSMEDVFAYYVRMQRKNHE